MLIYGPTPAPTSTSFISGLLYYSRVRKLVRVFANNDSDRTNEHSMSLHMIETFEDVLSGAFLVVIKSNINSLKNFLIYLIYIDWFNGNGTLQMTVQRIQTIYWVLYLINDVHEGICKKCDSIFCFVLHKAKFTRELVM